MSTTSAFRGVILGYRRGSNIQYSNYVYIMVDVDSRLVHSLVGCRVRTVDFKGNIYIGRVVRVVGSRSPKLLVTFKRNIPGQLIGRPVVVEKQKPFPTLES